MVSRVSTTTRGCANCKRQTNNSLSTQRKLRPGRFRLLLLAGGAGLRAGQGFLHHRGPQDRTLAGATANRQLEALAQHRCRPAVRVLLSAGRLGQGLPLYRLALSAAGQGPNRARAVSVV